MSDNNYKHLKITRNTLENPRRTRRPPRFAKREDLRGHGQKLNAYFGKAREDVEANQIKSSLGKYVFKFQYDGALDFDGLITHGVEFVGDESNQLCVVFASEDGLAKFLDHIERLGVNDGDITRKQILEAIEGIDVWSEEDRKSWAVRHIGFPEEDEFKVDVELWPVESMTHPDRLRVCGGFEKWLSDSGIRQLDKINLDSLLMYRLVVNEAQVGSLLRHSDVRLVDLPPVSGISYQTLDKDISELPESLESPSEDSAKVCILDSGINTNHPLLGAAIAGSESYVHSEEAFDLHGHGTAVAGIALYGDIEECNESNYWKPQFWLYNGKVLDRECNFDQDAIEKTLIDAVRNFVELGCRIFNVSLGNVNSPYDGKHVRGIAYLLDSLSREYDVLFVVSAGNFSGTETPPVPAESWREEYPEYLTVDESVIIDPAPSLNSLTVGSLSRHDATYNAQRYSDEINDLSPASNGQPSPFTRHGPSVRGAIKPDLVAVGGNLACPMRQSDGQWKTSMQGLGVLTFNNEFVGNTVFTEASGTSFSAPYVTHLAARLLNEYPEVSANMLKAMLINQAVLPEAVNLTFSDELKTNYRDTHRRDVVRDVVGYGEIDVEALFRSSENEVVLYAEDTIENNSHQFYELPLTEEFLRAGLATRVISVTLASSPAVKTTRLDYMASKISFRLVVGESLESVQASFNHNTQDNTATMNDVSPSNRDVSASLRDKGAVQSSTWTIRRRSNPAEKWFVVVTRQDRKWGEAISDFAESYALAVKVTDKDNAEAQLYTQIEQRIREQERLRAGA